MLEQLFEQGKAQAQFTTPQEGVVLRVAGGRCYVKLNRFPTVEHACRFSRPVAKHRHEHGDPAGTTGENVVADPSPGTRCLVVFADRGIASPWVVAFDGWPA